MIFVTVGEQLPFDRLVRAIDEWAGLSGHEVFAQTGRTDLMFKHIAHKHFLDHNEYRARFLSADLVVAHAGMGTIISAIEMCKPILVMPRLAALGEVRSDHQLATAKKIYSLGYASVAYDEKELGEKMNDFGKSGYSEISKRPVPDSSKIISAIRCFLHTV